jgi:hypothetical protein
MTPEAFATIAAGSFLFGLLNAARGAGVYDGFPLGNRIAAVLGMGAVLGLCGAQHRLAATACIWLMLLAGHGKYFMAFHGRDMRHEKECPHTDFLLTQIEKVKQLPNKVYGTLGMSLRYLIWSIPMIWQILPYGFYSWLLLGLAGPIYAFLGSDKSLRPAEFTFGAVIGMAVLMGQ